MIEILSKHFAVDSMDNANRTPLHFAANLADAPTVKMLIKLGANVNAEDSNLETPLYHATTKGQREIIEELMKAGANLKHRTATGENILSAAVEGKLAFVVKQLLEWGAAVEGDEPFSPELDLMRKEITKDNYEEKLEELTEVNDTFATRMTPLHLAAALGYKEIVAILMEFGANKEAKDVLGHTPLAVAVREEQEEMVKYLVNSFGVDIGTKDDDGFTPLHGAVMTGSMQLVKFFLEKGASASWKTNDGKTPFDIARLYELHDVMEVLLLADL